MACTSLQPAALSGQDDLTDTSTAPVWGIQHAWKLPTLNRINEQTIIFVINSDHSCLSQGRNFQKSCLHNSFCCMGVRFSGGRREGQRREGLPVRKYWISTRRANCYWSQVVGSKVHSTGNQQRILAQILDMKHCPPLPVWIKSTTRPRTGKHPASNEWEKWHWNHKDEFSSKMLNEISLFTWWMTAGFQGR